MKRLETAALCFFLLFFCACTQNEPHSPEPVRSFSCTAQIQQQALAFTAELLCTVSGEIVLTFTAPAELEGMTVTFSDGIYRARAHGLCEELPENEIPDTSCLRLLTRGLQAYLFTDTPPFTALPDGTFSAALPVNDRATVAVFDERGRILCMTSDDPAVTITFLYQNTPVSE